MFKFFSARVVGRVGVG